MRRCRKLLALVVLGLLSACIPVQQTSFSLVAPASEAGRQCVAESCAPAAEVCRRDCTGWINFCRDEARQDQLSDTAFRSRVEALTRDPERLTRPERSIAQCDARERGCQESCQVRYRSCFAGCGGQVTQTRS